MKLQQVSLAAMLLAVLASAPFGGCQSIIGIEDRTFDESLAAAGDGGRATSNGGSNAGGMNGTGGSEGPDGGSDGDAGAGGAPAVSGCEEYCALVETNCKNDCPDSNPACPDDLRLYSSTTICMNVCETFDPGDPSDPTGNTLACRMQQAQFAGTISDEAWAHCPAAGPGGAGVCGDNCESYCSMMSTFCTGEDFEQFLDEDCVRKCRGLRDVGLEPGVKATASKYGANLHHDGDFLQCRLVHVTSASEAPLQHCWHAALAPKSLGMALNPCADPKGTVPRCSDYCRLVMVSCPGELAVYDSPEQCEKACAAMEPGDATDDAGANTVGCRRNHAYNAMKGGPETHCPHSGPGGHVVCGDNCDSYCRLLAGACEDDFVGEAECLEECAELDGALSGYAVTAVEPGNNFQCRLRAVVRSFDDPANCSAAIGQGECSD